MLLRPMGTNPLDCARVEEGKATSLELTGSYVQDAAWPPQTCHSVSPTTITPEFQSGSWFPYSTITILVIPSEVEESVDWSASPGRIYCSENLFWASSRCMRR